MPKPSQVAPDQSAIPTLDTHDVGALASAAREGSAHDCEGRANEPGYGTLIWPHL
jgi:hypothetical protein